METFTTKHIMSFFAPMSHETVKRWASEFSDYLSPTARPEEGRTRQFTHDDLRVFDLIRSMKKQGLLFQDIHAALGAGQRGDLPEAARHSTTELTPLPANGALAAAITHANQLQITLDEERKLRIGSEAREKLLREMLNDANEEIAHLNRLLGANKNGS